MKLSESLKQLGKVVVYYPALARFFGSVNAAIFFAQLWYWQERSDHGYVWKTAAEIEEETGLSYREQHTARQVLCGLQVMVENHDRLRHEMHFTLDLDRLDALWNEHQTRHERPSERPQFGNDENAIPEQRKPLFPNDEIVVPFQEITKRLPKDHPQYPRWWFSCTMISATGTRTLAYSKLPVNLRHFAIWPQRPRLDALRIRGSGQRSFLTPSGF